jgi:hypothetical protein
MGDRLSEMAQKFTNTYPTYDREDFQEIDRVFTNMEEL